MKIDYLIDVTAYALQQARDSKICVLETIWHPQGTDEYYKWQEETLSKGLMELYKRKEEGISGI